MNTATTLYYTAVVYLAEMFALEEMDLSLY